MAAQRRRRDFWPAWLARDIPGLATWTLAYDAPPSGWLGTGMAALQDRAKNVLVLTAQGNLPEALKSLRDGLVISERLKQSDPGNAGRQSDLAMNHQRLGETERRLDHLAEARAAFERALAIYDALLKSNPENSSFLVGSTLPLDPVRGAVGNRQSADRGKTGGQGCAGRGVRGRPRGVD